MESGYFNRVMVSLWSVILNIPGPEVIKLFPCSTQLGTKFILLINTKKPTFDGILTFTTRISKTFEKSREELSIIKHFSFNEQSKFRVQLS